MYRFIIIIINVPLSLPSRTTSELHKLSKIEIFRSALRAEMFVSQERLPATQTFENQQFSLGASRRKGTQTNKRPHLMCAFIFSMCATSQTSQTLVAKIEMFRSALRAEMFTSQERRRATQTVENRNVSLGASRRKGTQTNKGPIVGYIKKFFSV